MEHYKNLSRSDKKRQEKIINKFLKKGYVRDLSFFKSVSFFLFDKHVGNVNWAYICSKYELSEEFLRRYIYYLNWESLSGNSVTIFSNEFMEEFIEYFNVGILFQKKKISNFTLNKFSKYIEYCKDLQKIGFVYSPWQILTGVGTVTFPSNWAPRESILGRYSTRQVNINFYSTIII